jgi:hypothetical protein
MSERKYLPTLGELIDRLSIVQLKEIYIPEHAAEYRAERELIAHDIDLMLGSSPNFLGAREVRAILMIMLANRVIWENESIARQGGDGQDKRLKFTHSINGIRSRAKNVIAAFESGRQDYKTDALAANLPPEFGNWDVI